ncbi:MAG: RIP metalloprotease RseP [Verrucomicrobiota bacterium]|nr:RIP metalloprotease RseP [Verrucomicrobiota bacterium]
MLMTLGIILFVLVFFGLCIFIHEFGHLIAALACGLHVDRFSIGFGKRLFGFKKWGVDFYISALPFGGYVSLPQLEPVKTPRDAEGNALPEVKPIHKIITAFAGPFFNILFGFFLASFVWFFGIYEPAPANSCIVSEVPVNSQEYKAGLKEGDEITRVNGKIFTNGWEEIAETIILTAGNVKLTVLRDGAKKEIFYAPAPNPQAEGLGYPFFKVATPVVMNKIFSDTPAENAGLLKGDIIQSINGEMIKNQTHFITLIKQSKGNLLNMVVRRDGVDMTIPPFRAEINSKGKEPVFAIGVAITVPMQKMHPTPWNQFIEIVDKTKKTVSSLFAKKSLVKPKHMSGPVGILQVIGLQLYSRGFMKALSIIILITFNLAFINLFPLPVIDGGHIVLAMFQLITKKQVPVKMLNVIYTIFAVILISFMAYVTFYDLQRAGKLFKIFSEPEKKEMIEKKKPETEKQNIKTKIEEKENAK